MRKALALLALSLVSAQAFAEKKTPEEYWAGTGLTLDVMANQIDIFGEENCYKSLPQFRGCVAALNSLAGRTEPASKIVPLVVAEDPSTNQGARIDTFTGLAQVLVKVADASDS